MVRFQSRPQHVYGLPRTLTVARITGFTLIELLVVMTIIATLLTLAVPRYFGGVDRAKEAVLKQNLATLRDCIVWEDARIAAESLLNECVVTARAEVSGSHSRADL